MRHAAVALAVVMIAVGAWFAGEQHRKNCLASGHTNCTVLPWDGGSQQDTTLTPFGCETLRLENQAAQSVDQIRRVPPECRP